MSSSNVRQRVRHEDDGPESAALLGGGAAAMLVPTKAVQADAEPALLSPQWWARYEWPFVHLVIFLVAIVTRFWRLHEPPAVVFDEHHFGRFTNQYMRGTYLFDIHPPMGKLVFWIVANVVGYDPEVCGYDNIGDKFDPQVCRFLALRATAASFGCLAAPILYSVVRRFGGSIAGGCLAAGFFLFDNLVLTESRLILVDSQLVFHCSCSLLIALIYYDRRREADDAEALAHQYPRFASGSSLVQPRAVALEVRQDADARLRQEVQLLGEDMFSDPEAADTVLKGKIRSGYGEIGARLGAPLGSAAHMRGVAIRILATGKLPQPLTVWDRLWWAVLLGFACGCAVSIKWTGLATPGMIALECFFALYFLRRPVDLPDILVMGASALAIYAFNFWVHFKLLPLHGDGDGFMRIEFQRTLVGNQFYEEDAPHQPFPLTFWQLNAEMLSANARIDTPHHWQSKWHTWPLNLRGILYYSKDYHDRGMTELVYLLGNPAVSWLALAFMIVAFAALFVYCRIRNDPWFSPSYRMRALVQPVLYCTLVYICNLLPYILVARSAFIYHYMPALTYACVASGLLLDLVFQKAAGTVAKFALAIVVLVWVHFAPWVYCLKLTSEAIHRRRWVASWD